MRSQALKIARDPGGFALIGTIIFVLVIVIAGMAFFAVASYETKGALYREESSEAFYLADGAIERLRAKFLDDFTWRAGWDSVLAGRGSYDLTVEDTTWAGYTHPVHAVSTGEVGKARRMIDVIADVPPTTYGLNLLVMNNACVGGNLEIVGGEVHVNGEAAGSACNGNPHFEPDTTYSEGYTITPPPIYTDAGHFPGATYYRVKGVPGPDAEVYDRNGNLLPFGTMANVVSYHNGSKTYTFDFDTATKINEYFQGASARFAKAVGDIAVVVNFGEPVDPPALYQRVVFDGNGSSVINATIINSRFFGPTDPDRIDWHYWDGWDDSESNPRKEIEVRQIIFEPDYGIAMIAENLNRTGSSHCSIGTAAHPALVYLTRDVTVVNSNFDLTGSLICLRNFHSTGGPIFTYNEGFIQNLPPYLQNGWPVGTSGTLKILRWREIASAS